MILILGFIFSIISYFALGLNDDSASKWFIFCKIYLDAAVVISTMSGNALGLLCAIIGGDPGTASTFVNMIVLPLVIFNGFFVNYDSIPPGVEYIRFISPFKYAFSIVIINEYTDLDLDCERECDPIAFLGLEDEEIWENFLGLLAMTIGIQVITVIVMIMMSRKLR